MMHGPAQEEVGHDAVQLLDRAMMAPEVPARDCMSVAAPAVLYLAVCQDSQHSRDALPLLSAIANLTGVGISGSEVVRGAELSSFMPQNLDKYACRLQ